MIRTATLAAVALASSSAAQNCGFSWSALPDGGSSAANSMVVFDDGSGPALFVQTADAVHKWNGRTWSALPPVAGRFLCAASDGAGAALFTLSANRVLRWAGGPWQQVGTLLLPGQAEATFLGGRPG